MQTNTVDLIVTLSSCQRRKSVKEMVTTFFDCCWKLKNHPSISGAASNVHLEQLSLGTFKINTSTVEHCNRSKSGRDRGGKDFFLVPPPLPYTIAPIAMSGHLSINHGISVSHVSARLLSHPVLLELHRMTKALLADYWTFIKVNSIST